MPSGETAGNGVDSEGKFSNWSIVALPKKPQPPITRTVPIDLGLDGSRCDMLQVCGMHADSQSGIE